MVATVGLKPCETIDGSNSNSSCGQLCPNTPDGYDAAFDGPLCSTCATTHNVDEDTWRGTIPSPTESGAISVADLSATHRDLLWVLSQTGLSESGPLHHALTDYYTDRIDQTRVCDTFEELIERNLVTKHTHDTTEYRLTESARRALSARQAWQASTRNAAEGGRE